jgi:hypothetical protein
MVEPSTAISAITSAMAGVPTPVQTSFFAALSQLLGGVTAIPAAWLKRKAQAVEDVTAGRSAVAAVLARGIAEETLHDPVAMQAAAEIYLPDAIRKARNRVQIAQLAAEHINDSVNRENISNAGAPDDDWMNSFMRFADDASSERLQDLFGRVLAGQVVRPGRFALSTLRSISEMDQSTAGDFNDAWAKSVGEAVNYGPEWCRGDGFSRWKRLAEVGLMAATDSAQFLPPYRPILAGQSVWSPMSAGGLSLLVFFPENCSARWQHIMFTRTGRELGSLLATPDFEANMREVGLQLATQGVTRIDLQWTGKPPETIYPPASAS